MVRQLRLGVVIFTTLAAMLLSACGDDSESPNEETPPADNASRSDDSSTVEESNEGDLAVPESAKNATVYCHNVSSELANQVFDSADTWGTIDWPPLEDDPRPAFPCGAGWYSPVNWETGEGADDLDGTPSDREVMVLYGDLPNEDAAIEVFAELRELAQSRVQNLVDGEGVLGDVYEDISTSGNAEAFLYQPSPELYTRGGATGFWPSAVVGRCETRVLTISVGQSVFFLGDGSEYSVYRGRDIAMVDEEIRRAYQLLGSPLCEGETPVDAIAWGTVEDLTS